MRNLSVFFAVTLALAFVGEAPAQCLVQGGLRGGQSQQFIVAGGNQFGNQFLGTGCNSGLVNSQFLGSGCNSFVPTNSALFGQQFAVQQSFNPLFSANQFGSFGLNPFGATIVVNRNVGNRFGQPIRRLPILPRVGFAPQRVAAGIYGAGQRARLNVANRGGVKLGAVKAGVRR